jgi:hypothetical protein
MTLAEGAERVAQIWPDRKVMQLRVRQDGGVEVHLELVQYGRGRLSPSDRRQRHMSYHELDANGHVTCHEDCKTLETKMTQPPLQLSDFEVRHAGHPACRTRGVHSASSCGALALLTFMRRIADVENPKLYDAARDACHSLGIPWTDPRTGVTHEPPTAK